MWICEVCECSDTRVCVYFINVIKTRFSSRSQVIPRAPERAPGMPGPVCTHRRPPKVLFTRPQVGLRQSVASARRNTLPPANLKKDICSAQYAACHHQTRLLYHVTASFMGFLQFYPEKYPGNHQNFDPFDTSHPLVSLRCKGPQEVEYLCSVRSN